MYNAIIDDELLNPLGVFKERLSQSALVAKMRTVSDSDAREVRQWLDNKGLQFAVGSNPETELTDAQIHEQCRMYIAALRIAHEFGCDAIGIQYQQGLKDMVPASDLVEGLLNNAERPPVFSESGAELYAGGPLPHFNEVDECAGLDALVTNRCWKALGFDPSTTLHDVRWGECWKGDGVDDFVWVLQISGAAPAEPFPRRLSWSDQRTAAGHVFSAGGWDAEGRGPGRGDRLEPRLCRGWRVACGSGAGLCN